MNKKSGIVSNFVWRFAERCGAQGISFIVSLVLARLVAPEAYGVVALITVFTKVLQVFIDSGLGNSLIQKKNADDEDFSSVFYFNLVICLILYVGMFLGAPYIAAFYRSDDLIWMIRILSLTLIISGVKNIQQAYVSRNMLFKRFFFATLGGTCVAAIIGIYMAYRGLGAWALIAQILINNAIDTLILWITVPWRPKLYFSYNKLKSLLSYGWKLLLTSLCNTLYVDVRELIIGRLYSPSSLAFYNKGMQLPNLVMDNINSSINSVLFPVLSSIQDEKSRLKIYTRKSLEISLYIISPMLIGLCCCSNEVILVLYSNKWINAVPYLQIFCCYYIFRPVEIAMSNVIKAIGKSDVVLKQEVLKKVFGVCVLLFSMWFGPLVMALSLLGSEIVNMMINYYPTRKLVDYSISEFLSDFVRNTYIAFLMGGVISLVELFSLDCVVGLLVKVPLGILVYFLLSYLTHNKSFEYLVRMLKMKQH